MRNAEKGFTLMELLVSTMMGAFIAVVAVGTLRTISKSAEMIDTRVNREAEVRFASNMIHNDLMNLYRGRTIGEMKLVGGIEGYKETGTSRLILYAVGRTKARARQPEGDVYEVEYFVRPRKGQSVLFRRLWPNPDEESEPGGVLTLIGEGINVFKVRYFDGENWQLEWKEQWKAIPHLVEVRIGSASEADGEKVIGEHFLVNYFRKSWRTGRSRQEKSAEETGEER